MNSTQRFSKIISAALLLLLAACQALPALPGGSSGKALESQAQRIQNPDADLDAVADLAARNTAFGLDFYRSVRGQPGNLFFSPYSLSTALAMTFAGARAGTETQMAETLHWDGISQADLHPAFNALDLQLTGSEAAEEDIQPFELSVANSLWGQQDYEFRPEFLDLLAMNYGAGLRLLDIKADPEAARQVINQWVEQQTKDRIQDLIPQGGLTPDARLVLANAIYFKADWLHTFEANNTQSQPFYRLDGSTVQAQMMSHKAAETLRYYAGDGFQAVEMPYVGEQVSMLVLLPDEGRFEAFEAGLDAAQLQTVTDGLEYANVKLYLPKFEFTSEYALADVLSGMGMPEAFCSGQKPDFSGMDGTQNLCIGQVFHKAFVAVDEKGTEAAAATAVMMEVMSALIEDVVTVQVDRPFIFMIRHNPTGAVLFAGRVTDPQSTP